MKSILFLLVVAFTVPTYAVNTTKVNQAVAEILNKIVSEDEFVDALVINLDQETDLEKPVFGASIEASTRSAAWSTETTSLKASLDFNSKPAADGQVELVGDLTGELRTNVYALAQYAANKDFCEFLDFDTETKTETETEENITTCETLKSELLAATTFKQQVMSVSKAFAAFEIEIKAKIAILEAKSKDVREDDVVVIDGELAALQESLEDFESVEFTENDEGLSVTGDFDDFFGGGVTFSAEVKEASASVTISFVALIGQGQLDGFSYFPREVLAALEANDRKTKETISRFAKGYVDFLKEIVTED